MAGQQERHRPSRLLMLVAGSIASVVAAVVTSEIWDAGVLGTAAVTPVIVALVTDTLYALAKEQPEQREPWWPPMGALVAAIMIGFVAFVIAAVVLTVPEVVADKSITGEPGHTTYFGNNENLPLPGDGNGGDCLDDIVQCIKDIIEGNR